VQQQAEEGVGIAQPVLGNDAGVSNEAIALHQEGEKACSVYT
jgi:hypothetical protein